MFQSPPSSINQPHVTFQDLFLISRSRLDSSRIPGLRNLDPLMHGHQDLMLHKNWLQLARTMRPRLTKLEHPTRILNQDFLSKLDFWYFGLYMLKMI